MNISAYKKTKSDYYEFQNFRFNFMDISKNKN